jgi:hypothetical protein
MAKKFMYMLFAVAFMTHAFPLSADPEMVFTDGDFNEPDWEVSFVEIGLGGTGEISTIPTAGNPGAYRRIFIDLNSGSGEKRLFTLHKRIGATYDPSTQGCILHLDYSEDAKFFDGDPNGQTTGPCLWQSGEVYVEGFPTYHPPTWANISYSQITNLLFDRVDPDYPSGLDTDSHPDFSQAGPPITVGFWRGLASSNFTCDIGLDNWMVTIDYDPLCPVQNTDLSTTGFTSVEPNPFVATTRLLYHVQVPGHVELTAHDILGRRVATLFSGRQGSGVHSLVWSGRDGRDETLPGGIYFCQFRGGGQVTTHKIVLAR